MVGYFCFTEVRSEMVGLDIEVDSTFVHLYIEMK